jgi:hypothetical protein
LPFECNLQRYTSGGGGDAPGARVDYARLEALLEESEHCRVFLRAGGGVGMSKLQREVAEATAAVSGWMTVGTGEDYGWGGCTR